MGRVEKTVFISYRRTNALWALAIFQNLTQHGYDVFFDYTAIASGDFETVILENIVARAHFLVLLTPSALERCDEPDDGWHREIEKALESRRNIVPIILEGFDFSSRTIASQLTGKLAALKHYNALRVPVEYFLEAMGRLRERYLNLPLDAVLHSASSFALKTAREDQDAARTAPVVKESALTAQQWFEQGFGTNDPDEKLRCFSQAIRLEPDYPLAYNSRGLALVSKGDLDGALQDYTEAIRLKPGHARVYNNRGLARADKGDLDGALQDYNEAIHHQPDHADAYYNRARIWQKKAAYKAAIADFQKYLDAGGGLRNDNAVAVEQIIRELGEKT